MIVLGLAVELTPKKSTSLLRDYYELVKFEDKMKDVHTSRPSLLNVYLIKRMDKCPKFKTTCLEQL